MITIHKPWVEQCGQTARLHALIDVDRLSADLWAEVPVSYGEYLCWERADAFLLAMLHYAMEFGHDIVCEAPVTDRLYEQLTELFIPCYCKLVPYKVKDGTGAWPVNIKCSVAPEIDPMLTDVVASGVSCGVDSMHVFATHPEITHGFIFDLHDRNYCSANERRAKAWEALFSRARDFMRERGGTLVPVKTNYDKGIVPGLRYEYQTAFPTLFLIYSLKKMISKYYIASGDSIEDFTLNIPTNGDVAKCEHYLFPVVSLGTLNVRLEAPALKRVEKVKDLIDYHFAHKYLNVCAKVLESGENCNVCWKCRRTILNLLYYDKLDCFAKVFDIKYVGAHLRDYLLTLKRGIRDGDTYLYEMRESLPLRLTGLLSCQDRLWVMLQLHFRDRIWTLRRRLARIRILHDVWRYIKCR